jgi:hypothetical protein
MKARISSEDEKPPFLSLPLLLKLKKEPPFLKALY